MGTSLSCCGDVFTCCRKHQNVEAVSNNQKYGVGRDLDDAVIAATNQNINQEGQLLNILTLSIECKNLPNLDVLTRTDAMCILYQLKGKIWQEVGRTEVIMDNLNPKFIKSFQVEYKFEERQKFKIKVFDIDDFSKQAVLDHQDYVGELEFMLHEIVTQRNQQMIKPLQNEAHKHRNNGQIIITADERSGQNNEMVEFGLECQFNSEDGHIFFIVNRWMSPGQYVPIYKSETQVVDRLRKSHKWNLFQALTSNLCKEEPDREIKIEFFKSVKGGNHRYMGCLTFTLADIKQNKVEYQLQKDIRKIGTLKFYNLRIAQKRTFLEYVFGGCEISLMVAIDFTLSNGNPSDRDSLHYFDPARNEYLQAISSVGQILQYYDSDKEIPVFGFGAKIPPVQNRPSHCFAVNGDIFNPECDGIDGVIEAYRNAIRKINFYGPTHFAPCLKMAVDMAENEQVSQENQKYFILLLITDGIINDIQQTIDEIVRGSSLPLSIIIVGVGEEDFKSMDVLDADDEPLYSQKHKKYMERDIVQFVPFRDYKNNPLMLAKKTLEEVPNQLLSYFDKKRIEPGQLGEEQKRQIQQKLSRLHTLKKENEGPPPFFKKLQEQFIEKCQDMGHDVFEVKDFLEEKGIPEISQELIIDYLKNPNYFNPLRIKNPARNNNQNQQNYQYFDPEEAGQVQNNQANLPNRISLPPINQNRQGLMPQMQQVPSGSANDCKICFAKKIDTILTPCGHRCICNSCATSIRNICPICRSQVNQIVKVFDV